MGNLLRVVSTFSALPKAIIILEHATFHQDVQSLNCFSMGSFIKRSWLCNVVYWSTLSISDIMLSVLMGHEGIACRTKLLADGALKTRSLQVLRLNMPSQCCTVLGSIFTFAAIPHAVRTSTHLAFDCRYQLLWIRFHSLFICKSQNLGLAISKWLVVPLAVTLVYVTL